MYTYKVYNSIYIQKSSIDDNSFIDKKPWHTYGWNSESHGMFGVVCNFYKFICQKLIVVHDYNKTKDVGVFLTCFHFCKFQKKFSDYDDTKINVNRFLLLFIYV